MKKKRRKAKAKAGKKLSKAALLKIRMANLAKARLARGKAKKRTPKTAAGTAAAKSVVASNTSPPRSKRKKKRAAPFNLPKPVPPPDRQSKMPAAGCSKCPTCGTDRRFFQAA